MNSQYAAATLLLERASKHEENFVSSVPGESKIIARKLIYFSIWNQFKEKYSWLGFSLTKPHAHGTQVGFSVAIVLPTCFVFL